MDAAGCKEVRHLLTQLSETLNGASVGGVEVPDVLILEDLHLATSLAEVLAPLASMPVDRAPFVIGTAAPVLQQVRTPFQPFGQYRPRYFNGT